LICLAADVREGKLRNVGFRVFACPHIIAACNWQADLLQGAPVDALQEVDLAELQLMFDIPVEKAGKLLILKDALVACHEHYEAGSASL
jgi:NifU-like protein involved in Fe-S cluster formation